MKTTIKRATVRLAAVAAAMLLLVVGCRKDEEESTLTVTDSEVAGLWVKSGSQEYWRYRTDHSGVTWDEADDISEQESNLTYTWSISGAVLTHVFSGAQGNQAVPKVYTITAISGSSMQWKDDYGMAYTLKKVQEK
ncbi:MAG: lipocalin family protein [Bacteroidales bacterium]|nr:lipocalin family protein [Bacteroidales bacterium]